MQSVLMCTSNYNELAFKKPADLRDDREQTKSAREEGEIFRSFVVLYCPMGARSDSDFGRNGRLAHCEF